MQETNITHHLLDLLQVHGDDNMYSSAKYHDRFTIGITADGRTSKDGTGKNASEHATAQIGTYLHEELEKLSGNVSKAQVEALVKRKVDEVDKEVQNTAGTTLDITIVDKEQNKLYVFHVGDGYVYHRKKDGTTELITEQFVDEDTSGPKWYLGKPGGYGHHTFDEYSTRDTAQVLQATDGFGDMFSVEQVNTLLTHSRYDTLEETLREEQLRPKEIIRRELSRIRGFGQLVKDIGKRYGTNIVTGSTARQQAKSILDYIDTQKSSEDSEIQQTAEELETFVYDTVVKHLAKSRDDSTGILTDFTGSHTLGFDKVVSLEQELSDSRDKLQEVEQKNFEAQTEARGYEARIEELEAEETRLKGEVTAANEAGEEYKSQLETVTADLEGVRTELEEAQQGLTSAQERASELEGKLADAEAAQDGLRSQLETAETEYKAKVDEAKEEYRANIDKAKKGYQGKVEEQKETFEELERDLRAQIDTLSEQVTGNDEKLTAVYSGVTEFLQGLASAYVAVSKDRPFGTELEDDARALIDALPEKGKPVLTDVAEAFSSITDAIKKLEGVAEKAAEAYNQFVPKDEQIKDTDAIEDPVTYIEIITNRFTAVKDAVDTVVDVYKGLKPETVDSIDANDIYSSDTFSIFSSKISSWVEELKDQVKAGNTEATERISELEEENQTLTTQKTHYQTGRDAALEKLQLLYNSVSDEEVDEEELRLAAADEDQSKLIELIDEMNEGIKSVLSNYSEILGHSEGALETLTKIFNEEYMPPEEPHKFVNQLVLGLKPILELRASWEAVYKQVKDLPDDSQVGLGFRELFVELNTHLEEEKNAAEERAERLQAELDARQDYVPHGYNDGEIQSLQDKIAESQTTIKGLQAEVEGVRGQLDEEERAKAEVESKLSRVEASLELRMEALETKDETITTLRGTLKEIREGTETLDERGKRLDQEEIERKVAEETAQLNEELATVNTQYDLLYSQVVEVAQAAGMTVTSKHDQKSLPSELKAKVKGIRSQLTAKRGKERKTPQPEESGTHHGSMGDHPPRREETQVTPSQADLRGATGGMQGMRRDVDDDYALGPAQGDREDPTSTPQPRDIIERVQGPAPQLDEILARARAATAKDKKKR